jgi:ribosomal protein L9
MSSSGWMKAWIPPKKPAVVATPTPMSSPQPMRQQQQQQQQQQTEYATLEPLAVSPKIIARKLRSK